MITGFEIAAMGGLLPHPVDTAIFVLAVTAGVTAVLIPLYTLIAASVALFSRWRAVDALRAACSTALFFVLFSQGAVAWIEFRRPVDLSHPGLWAGLLLVLLFCIALIVLALRLAKKWHIRYLIPRLGPAFAVLIIFLLVSTLTVSRLVSSTPIREDPMPSPPFSGRVLVLGVDAATWDTLDPLLEAGALPNLQRLIEEGASGPLPSLVSMYNPFAGTITRGIKSAAVWNSIFTGKTPYKHGIKDFIYTDAAWLSVPFRYPLLPSFTPARRRISEALGLSYRPYHRLMRTSKAVWNVVSENGGQVGALGWWMTWPAESVNGDFLSDRFDEPGLPQRWFPADLIRESTIDSLVVLMENPDANDVRRFTPYPFHADLYAGGDLPEREAMRHELVSNLMKSFYQDRFRSRLGLSLISKHKYDFFSVYFYGLDTVGHAFTRFTRPDLFLDVEPEEVTLFGRISEKYHMWIDEQIGLYLDAVGDSCTVIVCSDHGMGPWTGVRMAREGVRLSGSHRVEGAIVMRGPQIRQGVRIKPRNLLDITPTILHILGLPVAHDMDGAVIAAAFDPAGPAVTWTSTYETSRRRGRGEVDSNYDRAVLDRLRGLGYLK